jgi:hypothetical protein
MYPVSKISTPLLSLCLLTSIASPTFGMISIGVLDKEAAKQKYGITMHARKNGDAGIKVWLEFRKAGWLEEFTYAELRMVDARGKHVVSAQLQSNQVHHRQPKDITTVAFSAEPKQLAHCSFLVVCYGSNEGDVGYYLNVKDILDHNDPVAEKRNTAPLYYPSLRSHEGAFEPRRSICRFMKRLTTLSIRLKTWRQRKRSFKPPSVGCLRITAPTTLPSRIKGSMAGSLNLKWLQRRPTEPRSLFSIVIAWRRLSLKLLLLGATS